jgi:hypothetical protein
MIVGGVIRDGSRDETRYRHLSPRRITRRNPRLQYNSRQIAYTHFNQAREHDIQTYCARGPAHCV